ncbi:hypothetical protein BDZ91DRAFT_796675 [Kalaharituber pfeilii]|nr:hypothetical protein BDZ91DRAFT_796675 [Kalaharituber pfeilii]
MSVMDEDNTLTKVYHKRHSIDSSFSCLGLSGEEKKRKALGFKSHTGMSNTRSDYPDGDIRKENPTVEGRTQGRKWGYILSQSSDSSLGERRCPQGDEPSESLEAQAIDMFVPLRKMNPSVPTKICDNLSVTGSITGDRMDQDEGLNSSEVKQPDNPPVGEKHLRGRSGVTFWAMGDREQTKLDDEALKSVHGSSLQPPTYIKSRWSLGHKIATTLRYIGQFKAARSPGAKSLSEATTSSSSDTASSVTIALKPQNRVINRSGAKLWKRTGRGNARMPNSSVRSFQPSSESDTSVGYPLQQFYDAHRDKKSKQSSSLVSSLLGVISPCKAGRRSEFAVAQKVGRGATELTGVKGRENGSSRESEKFIEAGKHVIPRIGDGELVLQRDFPAVCKTLRRTKKSYQSLHLQEQGHPILPSRANISWTNVLQEFAGDLGNVKESGVRPISDCHRGRADSLLLSMKPIRQSHTLGRSKLSKSSACLTTTEMEECEEEDGGLRIGNSTDVTKSDDGAELETSDSETEEEDNKKGDEDEDEQDIDSENNGDDGSSADDDEDSKLRALLHQVGKCYIGYGETGNAPSAKSRFRQGRRKSFRISESSCRTVGNNQKGLNNLGPHIGNSQIDNITIQGGNHSDILATKSTFVGHNNGRGFLCSKELANENIRPGIMQDQTLQNLNDTQYAVNDIAGYKGEGNFGDQWRVNPGMMKFLVH